MIVVGAGIVGAACAYFLSQAGYRVRLLETHAPASAASGAADGAVSVASKRPGAMMTTALAGIELYRSLARDGLLAGLFTARPTVMIAENDDEAASLEGHATALSGGGMKLRRLEAADLRRDLPSVASSARLGIVVEDEGHAIGYDLVRRFIAASGVRVERETPVTGLVRGPSGRSVVAVSTPNGPVRADHFIIAAGNGSADLIGLPDVMRPRKGQLAVTERAHALAASLPGSLMSCAYLLSKDAIKAGSGGTARRFGLVIDPLRTGQFLIGGTREERGDTTTDLDAVRTMLTSAVRLLPGLAALRVIRTFAGVRTATRDGLPIVGRIPGCDNLLVATGFEGDGICLGPLIARAISQLVAGAAVAVDLAPFSPGRFEQRSLVA